MADSSEMIMEDLSTLYEPLNGESFEATFLGTKPMLQTDNERFVLEVSSTDRLKAKLKEISRKVLEKYGEDVWKGITGPEDSSSYTNYWIWVQTGRDLRSLDQYSTYQFKITSCSPFECTTTYSHGVDIKVNKD